jgi:hypothetical protein
VDGILDNLLLEELFSVATPNAEVIPQLENLKGTTPIGNTTQPLPPIVDIKSLMVDGFNSLPIRIRRDFLKSIVCSIEIEVE